jgi:hypothetical protein
MSKRMLPQSRRRRKVVRVQSFGIREVCALQARYHARECWLALVAWLLGDEGHR